LKAERTIQTKITEEETKWADWLRIRFTEGQRFLLLCIISGALCGLTAVAFHVFIHGLFDWLWSHASSGSTKRLILIMLTCPAMAGLVVGICVYRWAPLAAGSGIPQSKEAFFNRGGHIPFSSAIWRFLLGGLYVGMGNSLGREGPTIHISAAISSKLGRWAFRSPKRIQAMLPVGVAAGIAAAFNAPLSALTFVFEEVLENFSMKALGGMVVAVVTSAAISRTLMGEDPVLNTHLIPHYTGAPWMLIALPMGGVAGLLGHFFVRSVLDLRAGMRSNLKLPAWTRPAWGGLACGIFGLSAYFLTQHFGQAQHSVFSIGYESLEAAFQDRLLPGVLLTLLVLKFAAIVLNYASGGSGGLFSPTLYLGGMLGGLGGFSLLWVGKCSGLFHLAQSDQVIGGCVLLGMGAMFAAVIRCPITSLIMIFELTGNYSLILPLMAGNMIAWRIASRLQPVSIYNALLEQDGITLEELHAPDDSSFQKIPIGEIARKDFLFFRPEQLVSEAREMLASLSEKGRLAPVVDERRIMLGVVEIRQIYLAERDSQISGLMMETQALFLPPQTPLRRAIRLMLEEETEEAAVVRDDTTTEIIGWLTFGDVVRQQNSIS
jgi:chloride channel protein, CIC family